MRSYQYQVDNYTNSTIWFSVQLRENIEYTIGISGQASNMVIGIYDQAGRLITEDHGSVTTIEGVAQTDSIKFTPGITGWYNIKLNTQDNLGNNGDYSVISIDPIPYDSFIPDDNEIPPKTANIGTIADPIFFDDIINLDSTTKNGFQTNFIQLFDDDPVCLLMYLLANKKYTIGMTNSNSDYKATLSLTDLTNTQVSTSSTTSETLDTIAIDTKLEYTTTDSGWYKLVLQPHSNTSDEHENIVAINVTETNVSRGLRASGNNRKIPAHKFTIRLADGTKVICSPDVTVTTRYKERTTSSGYQKNESFYEATCSHVTIVAPTTSIYVKPGIHRITINPTLLDEEDYQRILGWKGTDCIISSAQQFASNSQSVVERTSMGDKTTKKYASDWFEQMSVERILCCEKKRMTLLANHAYREYKTENGNIVVDDRYYYGTLIEIKFIQGPWYFKITGIERDMSVSIVSSSDGATTNLITGIWMNEYNRSKLPDDQYNQTNKIINPYPGAESEYVETNGVGTLTLQLLPGSYDIHIDMDEDYMNELLTQNPNSTITRYVVGDRFYNAGGTFNLKNKDRTFKSIPIGEREKWELEYSISNSEPPSSTPAMDIMAHSGDAFIMNISKIYINDPEEQS